MRIINMDLINQIKELKDKAGVCTRTALEIMVDTEVCREDELPDAETMDAILRGIELKHSQEVAHVH
jgi:hypothetical protein